MRVRDSSSGARSRSMRAQISGRKIFLDDAGTAFGEAMFENPGETGAMTAFHGSGPMALASGGAGDTQVSYLDHRGHR